MSSKGHIIILGAGLSGALLAYRWRLRHPSFTYEILDQSPGPKREKTWSFHETDLEKDVWNWLAPLAKHRWDGYEVRFPEKNRTLRGASYASLKSESLIESCGLHDLVRWNCKVERASRTKVTLSNGATMEANLVVDARGLGSLPPGGYQKFLGLEVTLQKPHGLERPILMDATVPQTDGYRFLYVLPWSPTSLLVEDTYYSNSAALDTDALRKGVLAYIKEQGWYLAKVTGEEKGILPLPTSFEEEPQDLDKPLAIGMGGHFFHPVTSYSVPWAASIAHHWNPHGGAGQLQELKSNLSKNKSFYLLLNRMLFEGAIPEERWQIFQRFYGLSEPLIQRFYGGRSHLLDQIRIFSGRPPLPLGRAVRVLLSRNCGKEARA